MMNQFDGLVSALDNNAPLRHMRIVNRPDNPWFSPEILASRLDQRRHKRVWMKA